MRTRHCYNQCWRSGPSFHRLPALKKALKKTRLPRAVKKIFYRLRLTLKKVHLLGAVFRVFTGFNSLSTGLTAPASYIFFYWHGLRIPAPSFGFPTLNSKQIAKINFKLCFSFTLIIFLLIIFFIAKSCLNISWSPFKPFRYRIIAFMQVTYKTICRFCEIKIYLYNILVS
jgi:hypothetical protein